MAKILSICGSPRNGASEYTMNKIMDVFSDKEGIEAEAVFLKGKKINFCIHCDKCLREEADRCVIYDDDMVPFYDKFYQADAYMVVSPVYDMSIPAQLSVFFNRFRATYTILKDNPGYFMYKLGSAVTVGGTRNGGQESAIKVIHDFYNTMGITVVNGSMAGYAGASVWSADRKGEGAAGDEFGMKNSQDLAEKLASLALVVQKGLS